MCQECRYCYHPAMFDPTKALCIYTGAYAPCTRVCVCVYIYIYIHVCVCGRTRLCLVCVCVYVHVCVCARVVSSFIRSLRDAQVFHDVGYWCSCTCSYLGPSHILTLSLVERKKKKKKFSGKKGIGSKFPFREITNHARLYWRRWTIKIWTIPIEDKKQDVACKKKKENRFLPVRRIIFVMERGTVS